MKVANLELAAEVGVTVAECGSGEDDLVVSSAFVGLIFLVHGKEKGDPRGFVKKASKGNGGRGNVRHTSAASSATCLHVSLILNPFQPTLSCIHSSHNSTPFTISSQSRLCLFSIVDFRPASFTQSSPTYTSSHPCHEQNVLYSSQHLLWLKHFRRNTRGRSGVQLR